MCGYPDCGFNRKIRLRKRGIKQTKKTINKSHHRRHILFIKLRVIKY